MPIGLDTTFLVQIEIRESSSHAAAQEMLESQLLRRPGVCALTPQVLTEFVHVVSDPKRFERPLSVSQAIATAGLWWNAAEVRQVYPTDETVRLFLAWMQDLKLGRKRLLDTMLAATYFSHGIRSVVSSNARDYRVFGCFEVISP